jgi:outer membrane receptor protein involved in Fe transport
MVNRPSRLLAAAALAACLAAPARAQSAGGAGSIRGVVTDREFGSPIAGASVSVLGTKVRAQTRDDGSYVLPNLGAGSYTLVITRDGFVREVKANVAVAAGQLVDADASMAGEFEDMEEFVSQDAELGTETVERQELVVPETFEPVLVLPPVEFQLRLEAPQLLNVLNVEAITRSGAGDAAAALLLVPGASLQEGKYAVIRGLPDRYVQTLLDGIRLPTADPDKRAVKLDQFPTAVIESIEVSKNFTPDQQGDSSGGAVNLALRSFPTEGYLRVSAAVGMNSQVKDGEFLNYPGGGLSTFGGNDTLQIPYDLNGQSWPNNPTGTEYGDAPAIYKWSVAAGDSWEVGDGVRVGAFGNFYYDADATAYNDGQLNSLEQAGPGTPLVPEQFGSGADFTTELWDVSQGTQSVQWGGLLTLGVESEHHRLGVKGLYTELDTNQAVLLTDTRGKQFFFPGYNPDDPSSPGFLDFTSAPWQRFETLNYSTLNTESLILSGEHYLGFLGPDEDAELDQGEFGFGGPSVNWRFSLAKASENQPDQTQFAASWVPGFEPVPGLLIPERWGGLPPAQDQNAGFVQHIRYYNEESAIQGLVDIKLPFTQWNDREGYIKTGMFLDGVSRSYLQDTFSNPTAIDPNNFQTGLGWDQPWSLIFPTQDHPMEQSTRDISYDGALDIYAGYAMADLPFNDTMSVVGGVRYEGTHMSTTVLPDADALWVDTVTQTLLPFNGPNLWDADFTSNNFLPMVGWNWNVTDDLVMRTAFAQTIARPNFQELVPVIQYDYIGGPIFIGNPSLQMSSLNNYDARLDWMPYENWLVSGSVFYKTLADPIQYVQRFTNGFVYTTPLNFTDGYLLGFEAEGRVTFEEVLGEGWRGLAVGGNFTYMESSVTLPEVDQAAMRAYGFDEPTQPMTATPDFLFNASVTYDIEDTGTQVGLFYNYRGKSLVSGANAVGTLLTPSIYQLGYGTLNFTASQELVDNLFFSFNAKNLTNPLIQTQYETPDGFTGLNSQYTSGISLSFALTYQLAF